MGNQGRHHLDPTVVQRAVKQALTEAGVSKAASCSSFRHSLATLLLGHSDMWTTVIYTHVLNRGPGGIISPEGRH
jgi:site-specific recombinase XerD